MLTHWLTCLQPQRLSTKPFLLSNALMWEKPATPASMADEEDTQRDPTLLWQLCPGLSVTDSLQTLRATAAPAFESSLCFTYNVQADANLCSCTSLGFSHPLVTAYTHTQHKPLYTLQKINVAWEVRAGVLLAPSQAQGQHTDYFC